MQTTKLKKKGFTLVELVVVVAVIAVLSAILIPSIGCVVEEAKETNDMATVRLLNAALAEDQAENDKPATMTDALAAMAKKGYLVDKLTPRSSGEILWDSVSNRFMLIKGENVLYRDNSVAGGEDYELWKVLNSGDKLSDKYSNYLKDGYVFNSETPISTGLDVGNNANISEINYVNSNAKKSVVIRTNSYATVVNIYAPTDIIKHYGQAKEVNIAEVDNASYHEYGDVLGNIAIAKGNVEVENGASVSNIVIKSVTVAQQAVTPIVSGDVKVQVKAEAKVNTVQSQIADITASEITSGEGATQVATIEQGDSNVAYVGKTGYSSFDDAWKAAYAVKGTVILTQDCQSSEAYTIENDITIDLNGHSLTYLDNDEPDSTPYQVQTCKLTIKNGKIIANGFTVGNVCLFATAANSSVYAYNVEIETTGTAFFPRGDASEVIIENCKINAGIYAVGTTAHAGNEGVVITIKNSELSAKGAYGTDGDTCTVMINVSGTLNIEDSTIYGHRTAVLVRAGTANIKNTTISADLVSKEIDTYVNPLKDWSTGNEVPSYPVVIGDTNSESYNANAVCTLNNVKILNTSTSNADRFIYMANDGTQYATKLFFDSASSGTTYVVRTGSTVYVNGEAKTGE